jgi:hypothetical protein
LFGNSRARLVDVPGRHLAITFAPDAFAGALRAFFADADELISADLGPRRNRQ